MDVGKFTAKDAKDAKELFLNLERSEKLL